MHCCHSNTISGSRPSRNPQTFFAPTLMRRYRVAAPSGLSRFRSAYDTVTVGTSPDQSAATAAPLRAATLQVTIATTHRLTTLIIVSERERMARKVPAGVPADIANLVYARRRLS